jgi:putative endopeptidase
MSKPVSAAAIAAFLLVSSAYASVDPATLDLSVRPQDDFYRYTNGTWIKNTPIPAEYSRWAAIDILQARNVELLNGICVAAAGKGAAGTPLERLVGAFYASGMDEAAVNAADAKDSNMVIAQVRQGGLGLPNRDYYINDDDKSKKLREEYVHHVEALRARVKTDPHSPLEFRCNGLLSNLDEFAEAFDVPEGAPMRRPAADRVSIW